MPTESERPSGSENTTGSQTWTSNNGPFTRRRSKKACSLCRTRKVRCDVSRRAPQPCSNCEQDAAECVVLARKRRRQVNYHLGPWLSSDTVLRSRRNHESSLVTAANDQHQVSQEESSSTSKPHEDREKHSDKAYNVVSRGPSVTRLSAAASLQSTYLDSQDDQGQFPLSPYNHVIPARDLAASPQSRTRPYEVPFDYVDYGSNPGGNARPSTPPPTSMPPSPNCFRTRKRAPRRASSFIRNGDQIEFSSSTNLPNPNTASDFLTGFEQIPEWTFNPEFISQSLGEPITDPLPRFEEFVPIAPTSNIFPSFVSDSSTSPWCLVVQPSKLSDLPMEDVQFLHTKGALHIPVRAIFNELISTYFRWVHPTLPMISEDEFWSLCIDSGDSCFNVEGFSLFVLQALLFAACAFAPDEFISRCGFSSIREARHTFYRRAKLLFDLDTEKRPYYMSCGSLLLAYHAPNKNERQVNSFWLEEAIRSARIAGAHRHYEQLPGSPGYATKLKKLWWCCIFRDRILPIGVRRPLQISADYFSTAPESRITLEDFQQDLGKSRVYKASTQKDLFRLFVLSCILAEILTDLITSVYPAGQQRFTILVVDMAFFKAMDNLNKVKTRLDEWLETCTFQFTPPFCVGEYEDSVAVFANLLFMFHDGAMLALHNEMVTLWCFRANIEEALRSSKIESINNDIKQVISGLRNKVQELVQARLIKFLPVSICAFLMLPMLLHIFDLKSAGTPLKAALRRRQFEIHMETMRQQRINFDGTDFVVEYLEDYARFIDGIGPVRRPDTDRSSASTTGQAHEIIGSWEELLLTFPMLYLRFVKHLDTTLSTGAYPNELSFPTQLQLYSLGMASKTR